MAKNSNTPVTTLEDCCVFAFQALHIGTNTTAQEAAKKAIEYGTALYEALATLPAPKD